MMKKNVSVLCFLLLFIVVDAQQKSTAHMQWFQQARFGMFIHFGLYAIPARGEWVRNAERISNEAYQVYFDSFNPAGYDPVAWAKMAKAAGMKYAIMTAKHHDGFCLFDSRLTTYTSMYTPAKRDLIREFLDAFRNEGIRVGLYYSVIDWHHPDYPAYGDAHHPMRDNAVYKNRVANFDNYLTYMHGQVKELVTKYGKIDVMWFDFSYGEMTGEKWRATELVNMVRKYQPDIILNNRLSGDGASGFQATSLGDYDTPEQGVPEKGRTNQKGEPVPWEACLTMNNSWGYNANDDNWKSPELIIHTLVNCVSKNGNLLLNVGPDANGRIPEKSIEILSVVGRWMSKNGKSIYGCGAVPDLPKPDWGRFTGKGKLLYAHLMHPHIGHINLKDFQNKVKQVRVLATGAEAFTANTWWGDHSTNNFFINVGKTTYLNYPLPDSINTVYEIELK